ncbi:MAG: TolC family protein [Dysgonamonadaceae bacterium]
MKPLLIYTILLLCNTGFVLSARQDTLHITLDEAIHRAINQSVDAVVARNEYAATYWNYRRYRADLLPEFSFAGTLPYYTKSYDRYQNSDGNYSYVVSNYSQWNGALTVTQNLALTGGKISLESSTQKLSQYGSGASKSWKSIPFAVTLEQPLFGFNSLNWQKKIEPVKRKEAEQKLLADIETTSSSVVTYYFNLLIEKINLEIARQNLENANRLYKIAEARFRIGQISENELLQLKVGMLNSESDVVTEQTAVESRMFELRSYIGVDENTNVEPVLPEFVLRQIPILEYARVLQLAQENNAISRNILRQKLEAERDVTKAKAQRWDISLYASVGRVGENDSFLRSYEKEYMRDNQMVQVGVKIPLLDWGKRKSQVKIAETNREVVNAKTDNLQRDFNRQIFIAVQNFNNQPKQLTIAIEADTIAQKRYQTSVEAFVLGKTDVLNLNDAQSAKDVARRNRIQQLYALWSYYFQIRALTAYDFIENKPLSVNYREFIKD